MFILVFFSPSVPSAISVSHAEEEEVEFDVEGGEDKNVSAGPSRSGDDEPSTSVEQAKQEVRNNISASVCECSTYLERKTDS